MNRRDADGSDSADAIETAAVTWLVERDEGFTPERARAFAAWREADLRHAEAIAAVEQSLALLAEMPAARAPLAARLEERAVVVPFPRRRPRTLAALWLAGLAAAVVFGSALWWRAPRAAVELQNYATALRGPQRVELPDGSVLNLKSGSDVRVDFSAAERRIALTTGEAHFDVAHDIRRPFIVSAAGVAVRAVGTAFNVRLAETAVEVLVVEGKVELASEAAGSAAGGGEPGVVPATSGARPLLAAGEVALVARGNGAFVPKVEKAEARLIRETLAWHSRAVNFSDVSLRDAITQFNRRNVTQLIILDSELGARKIGGRFELDQVDAFVRLLEQDGDVQAEARGDNEIVLRRVR